jgi:hypothetical protein
MTVVKMEMLRLPRIEKLDPVGDMPIMVTGNQDQLAKTVESFD